MSPIPTPTLFLKGRERSDAPLGLTRSVTVLNPSPKVKHRLIYRAANGVAGRPSPDADAGFE